MLYSTPYSMSGRDNPSVRDCCDAGEKTTDLVCCEIMLPFDPVDMCSSNPSLSQYSFFSVHEPVQFLQCSCYMHCAGVEIFNLGDLSKENLAFWEQSLPDNLGLSMSVQVSVSDVHSRTMHSI